MHISPRFTVGDWKALNLTKNSDWRRAVRILEDRLKARFFDAVEAIQGQDFSGFAVLALDCLLIETLQQFKEGVAETPRRKGEEYFVNFLTTAPFAAYFNKAGASTFYDHFRCGILHQAEIKGSSKVWRVGPLIAAASDGKGLIINRKIFHSVLGKAFANYLRILRNRTDKTLCENFVRKMSYICR
jgi:hypothetical protein